MDVDDTLSLVQKKDVFSHDKHWPPNSFPSVLRLVQSVPSQVPHLPTPITPPCLAPFPTYTMPDTFSFSTFCLFCIFVLGENHNLVFFASRPFALVRYCYCSFLPQ